ncbi:hypothetical protein [Nocardia sp. NPDC019395]|uniref:hypothetical protein n=1 Tax=Nocardia sp. NPDC019395 TaxID=3154686 RepID=UPI0033E1D9A2
MKPPVSRSIIEAVHKVTQQAALAFRGAAGGVHGSYGRIADGSKAGREFLRMADEGRGKTLRRVSAGALGAVALTQIVDDEPSRVERVVEDTLSEFDPAVQRYAGMSPFLVDQLETLHAEGWTIKYGDVAGKYGESTKGEADHQAKQITIDDGLKDDSVQTTRILAHEVGHVYPGRVVAITDPPTPGEKFPAWLARNMRELYAGEAESELVTARVRKEILDAGGPDITRNDEGGGSTRGEGRYGRVLDGELSYDEARDGLTDTMEYDPNDIYISRLEKEWDEKYADSHGPSTVRPGEDWGPDDYVGRPPGLTSD